MDNFKKLFSAQKENKNQVLDSSASRGEWLPLLLALWSCCSLGQRDPKVLVAFRVFQTSGLLSHAACGFLGETLGTLPHHLLLAFSSLT